MRRFEASRERFRNRGEHRGATILRFRLSRDARLVLVVRGPGPSCEVVARIPLRGRAGANRYRFTGRIQGRPLAPGTYLLTPRLRGTHRPLGRELVTILAPGQSSAPHVAPRCGRGRDDVAPAAFPAAVDRIEAQRAALPDDIVVLVDAPPEPSPPRVGEVAGEATPATPALPLPAIARGVDELPPVLGIVLLALLAGSLVGVAAAVVHYLRSA